MRPRIGSLFSGAGGLDLGVLSVLGGEMAWHCETDPAASRVLEHRWPEVPNHGDVTSIDWAQVEPVDVVEAGWPCQPFSLAGKRKGADDERALWPEVARAVGVLRPRLVVLENVAAVAAVGELGRATASLAALGYVGSWACVRASDVGAPHRRERCFVVAWPAEGAGLEGDGASRGDAQRPGPVRSRVAVADPDRDAVREQPVTERRGGGEAVAGHARSDAAANADGDGLAFLGRQFAEQCHSDRRGSSDTAWGQYEPAIRRWEHLSRPAPAPTETGPKGGQRLSPRFTEWLMGWPDGWVTDVPGVTRNDALKICGNGVVPQQAAEAVRRLITHLEERAA